MAAVLFSVNAAAVLPVLRFTGNSDILSAARAGLSCNHGRLCIRSCVNSFSTSGTVYHRPNSLGSCVSLFVFSASPAASSPVEFAVLLCAIAASDSVMTVSPSEIFFNIFDFPNRALRSRTTYWGGNRALPVYNLVETNNGAVIAMITVEQAVGQARPTDSLLDPLIWRPLISVA